MHLHCLKDEKKIVALILNQDPLGMQLLYDGVAAPIYGAVLRFANGNEALANKLLSATFEKVAQDIHHYQPKIGSFFCWILNVARCLAKDDIIKYSKSADCKNNKHIFDLMMNKGLSINDVANELTVSRMECAAILRKELRNLSSPS